MEHLSNAEILNFAIENGIIDMNTIQEKIMMNERKKYIEQHKGKIWKSTDNNWYTYLPDHIKGKRLVKRKTKESLMDEIVKKYKELEMDPTIESVFYEWIEKKLKYGEIQKQTYDRYVIDFKKYFSDNSFKHRKVRFVDYNALEDFIMDCILKYQLTSKAYGNLRIILRGMLLYAKRRGYTEFNAVLFFQEIALSKKVFRKNKKEDVEEVFTNEEIRQIIDFLESDSVKLTNLGVLLAIYTGMRVGEVVALKWEDVNEKHIHVNRSQIIYKDEYGKKVYDIRDFPKTEAGVRNIIIIPEIQNILKRARTINPFTEYIFEKNGKNLTTHALSMVLYRACDKLGFPRRGMHALRRTYATNLINSGVDESVIINQMGHTDFKTTKDYYYYNNETFENIKNILTRAVCY